MTEDGLREANGLVAQFYSRPNKQRLPSETLFALQRRLLYLGVHLDHPVEVPDPTAPPGGSALTLRVA